MSVSEMLSLLKWPSLEQRRYDARLKMFYNIYNDVLPTTELKSVLIEAHYIGRNDHNSKVCIITARHKYFQNSFFPRTICDWNSLPQDMIDINNKLSFANSLKKLRDGNNN